MSLVDSDIVVYKTYGNRSLGNTKTTAKLTWTDDETKYDEGKHQLFERVHSNDIENARPQYACIAIANDDASVHWENVKAWIVWSGGVQSEVTISIQKDTVATDKTQQVPSRYEAPSAITFKEPTTKGHADVIDMGTINFGEWGALWIKRTPTVSAKSRSFEECTIRIEGDDANGSTTFVGQTVRLIWDTITGEIRLCLKKLNDIPPDRVDLEGAQEYYDDSAYLVNQLSSSEATDAQKQRIALARTMYLVYQEYTVELERAGGGLPPMVVSRVYELRRIANEMFNSIAKTPTRMNVHAMKGRSQRGRLRW